MASAGKRRLALVEHDVLPDLTAAAQAAVCFRAHTYPRPSIAAPTYRNKVLERWKRMQQVLLEKADAGPRRTGTVSVLDVGALEPAVARLLALVSRATGVSVDLLRRKSRGKADVAEARQLAMYLMHVVLQRTYEDIGRALGRERTTVSYACAVIEDRRDDPRFETLVARLEAEIGSVPQQEMRRAVG